MAGLRVAVVGAAHDAGFDIRIRGFRSFLLEDREDTLARPFGLKLGGLVMESDEYLGR